MTRELIIYPFISKFTSDLNQPNSGFPNFDLCLQFHSLGKGMVNVISLPRRQKLGKRRIHKRSGNLDAIQFYLGQITAVLVRHDHLPQIYYGFWHLYAQPRPAPNRLRSGVRKVSFSTRMQTAFPRYGKGLERTPLSPKSPEGSMSSKVTTWAQNFIQPCISHLHIPSSPTMTCLHACAC